MLESDDPIFSGVLFGKDFTIASHCFQSVMAGAVGINDVKGS